MSFSPSGIPGALGPRDNDRITALALRAGRGDRAALTEFIEATQDDVWRLLAHLSGRELADDLTQETYLKVMSALPRFAARSSARTWLLSLARHTWIDHIRYEKARPQKATDYADFENSGGETPTTPGTNSAVWAEWLDVRARIDELPEERREALILTQVLGYSYQEAAVIAGVRVGTIRSRVARARKDLIAGKNP